MCALGERLQERRSEQKIYKAMQIDVVLICWSDSHSCKLPITSQMVLLTKLFSFASLVACSLAAPVSVPEADSVKLEPRRGGPSSHVCNFQLHDDKEAKSLTRLFC